MVDFDDAGKKNWAESVQAALTLKPGSARDTPERQHAKGAASDPWKPRDMVSGHSIYQLYKSFTRVCWLTRGEYLCA